MRMGLVIRRRPFKETVRDLGNIYLKRKSYGKSINDPETLMGPGKDKDMGEDMLDAIFERNGTAKPMDKNSSTAAGTQQRFNYLLSMSDKMGVKQLIDQAVRDNISKGLPLYFNVPDETSLQLGIDKFNQQRSG